MTQKQTVTCHHGQWRPANESNTFPCLPAGTYSLQEDVHGLYLEEGDSFTLPGKLYGGVKEQAKRIIQTFLERQFLTGVLLEGEKGSGKTLLAKQVSLFGIEVGIPTILVNSPFHGVGFNAFMQQLHQPCIVLFDEFEKVYNDREDQQALLTFLDGTVPTKKLCVLTVNDSWGLDTNLVNRPGRLFYSLSFDTLDEAFIREYVVDRLENKGHIEEVVRVATTFARFNFDQLQALVEEMNRYHETAFQALRWLNIKPSWSSDKDFLLRVTDPKGKLLELRTKTWSGNPLNPRNQDNMDIFYFPLPKRRKMGGVSASYTNTSFTPDDFAGAERGELSFRNAEGFTVTFIPKPPPNNAILSGYETLSEA